MAEDLKAKAQQELAKAEAEAARQRELLKSMEVPWVEIACKLHPIFCSQWCDLGDWGSGHFTPEASRYNADARSREVYGRYNRAATEILTRYCGDRSEALKAVEAVAAAVAIEEDRKRRGRYY